MKAPNFEKDKWYRIIATYNGSEDSENIKIYYTKNIDGVDYRVCEQNGVIIEKHLLKDEIW